MATTTTTVGETVTRTNYTSTNPKANRGLYWGLAAVALVIIALAVMLTANRTRVNDTVTPVTPSTSTELNGAAPLPTNNDTPMSTDLPPTETRGTTDVQDTPETAPTSP